MLCFFANENMIKANSFIKEYVCLSANFANRYYFLSYDLPFNGLVFLSRYFQYFINRPHYHVTVIILFSPRISFFTTKITIGSCTELILSNVFNEAGVS